MNNILEYNPNAKHLVNIDYLIVNLDGVPFGTFPDSSDFKINYYDYGTKIFQFRAEVYYKNLKYATIQHSPRSAVLDVNLAQLQIENHIFYTFTLQEQKTILDAFCSETNYLFKSVNRLDICVDKCDVAGSYKTLYDSLQSGKLLMSGRTKNFQSYSETVKGVTVLNGFQVGKRTSEKLLRVYNKTLSLLNSDKPYIQEYFNNNGLKSETVWRFEYQLNSRFFRDLKRVSPADGVVTEGVTWNIFEYPMLFELLKESTKGFFEIHVNTGKSQVNKEDKISIFDFDVMRQIANARKLVLKRLKKVFQSSETIKKRLAKSLFREYYTNFQDVSYIVALNRLLLDYDKATGKTLFEWFGHKCSFYLMEFKNKEKLSNHFDFELYHEHQTLFL